MNPKFSIIIPVYNVAPYLRECLDSVLAQIFTDWEAICVDDGSTDGSGDILDEYAKRDARFRVVHQVNAGVSAARNAALDGVVGEWVCFLDSDDKVGDLWLADVEEALRSHPQVDWVRTAHLDWHFLKDGTSQMRVGSSRHKDVALFEDVVVAGWRELGRAGLMVLNFYRRSSLNGLQFDVSLKIAEDTCFAADMLCRVTCLMTIPSTQYFYRVRIGSAAQSPMSSALVTYAMRAVYNRWKSCRDVLGGYTPSICRHAARIAYDKRDAGAAVCRDFREFVREAYRAGMFKLKRIPGGVICRFRWILFLSGAGFGVLYCRRSEILRYAAALVFGRKG